MHDAPNRFDEEPHEPIVIPHRELSAEALRGVVESFVLREGTDYGPREFVLEQKVAHVLAQLERGDAQILFDPNSETAHIVTAQSPCSMPLSLAQDTSQLFVEHCG